MDKKEKQKQLTKYQYELGRDFFIFQALDLRFKKYLASRKAKIEKKDAPKQN